MSNCIRRAKLFRSRWIIRDGGKCLRQYFQRDLRNLGWFPPSSHSVDCTPEFLGVASETVTLLLEKDVLQESIGDVGDVGDVGETSVAASSPVLAPCSCVRLWVFSTVRASGFRYCCCRWFLVLALRFSDVLLSLAFCFSGSTST